MIASSRGSSQPRDQSHVSFISCLGRWILYHSAIQRGHYYFVETVRPGGQEQNIELSWEAQGTEVVVEAWRDWTHLELVFWAREESG